MRGWKEKDASGERVYPEEGHFAGEDWAFHQIWRVSGPLATLEPGTPACVFTVTAIAALKCEGTHSLPKLKTSILLNEHLKVRQAGVRSKKKKKKKRVMRSGHTECRDPSHSVNFTGA